jgi:hypothetical protein
MNEAVELRGIHKENKELKEKFDDLFHDKVKLNSDYNIIRNERDNQR